MEGNDFIGSFADENVTFQTVVVKTASVGDNFWTVMVFVENDRYIADTSIMLPIAGIDPAKAKAGVVDSTTFASSTNGLLQSWLVDLYANGFTGNTYLVSIGAKQEDADTTLSEELKATLAEVYEVVKPYAYHKTILVGGTEEAQADAAAALANLSVVDKELLSSPVLVPYTTVTPETPDSDNYYKALKDKFAILTAHQDSTRNGSLYRLGIAMGAIALNDSGTVVGNQMGMVSTGNITASGADGTPNTKTAKTVLKQAHIGFFKPIGDNTGNVACEDTLYDVQNGDVYSANWVKAYVGYMTKVGIAQIMTRPGFRKSERSYNRCLEILSNYLTGFVGDEQPLAVARITAPAFANMPPTDSDELIIQNAWEATYQDVVRKVTITGTLYIGG